MNPIQLGIVVVVGALILLLIGYFWYQEIKFKKVVEQNFNQKVDDVIISQNSVVLDGVDSANRSASAKNVLDKDIAELFNNVDNSKSKEGLLQLDTNQSPVRKDADYPEDSVEALFTNVKKIPFPYANEIDETLDYVVNIVFEEPLKVKVLPDIASLTKKHFNIFVLDNQNNWVIYQKGNKYNALGLKVVVHLVDKNGIINQAQLETLYKELFKFTMQYNGFIEQSNYKKSIHTIIDQIKYLPELKLELELFLILKNSVDRHSLVNFFMNNGFTDIGGKLNYIINGVTQYIITDEFNNGLVAGETYTLLKIVSDLHFVPNPQEVLDNIFDMAERFMEQFESRILTVNRQVFGEREYLGLTRCVNNYVNNAKKYGVTLGGELIYRLMDNKSSK